MKVKSSKHIIIQTGHFRTLDIGPFIETGSLILEVFFIYLRGTCNFAASHSFQWINTKCKYFALSGIENRSNNILDFLMSYYPFKTEASKRFLQLRHIQSYWCVAVIPPKLLSLNKKFQPILKKKARDMNITDTWLLASI